MVAKRALDFSTPNRRAKRSKTTMVVYRGPKSEMKYFDTNCAYTAKTSQVSPICLIANGSGRNARIGGKLKIHRIQALISLDIAATQPIRLEVLLPRDTNTAPTFSYAALTNADQNATLFSKFLNSGTENAPSGYYLNYKPPLGIICHYDDATGASIVRGNIHMCLATQTTATFNCTVRVWYTDA